MNDAAEAVTTADTDTKCPCGAESDYAAHGIRDQEIYDEHWCAACWTGKEPAKVAEESIP